MALTAECGVARYRVEVSGWDESRAFFVENSDLDWSQEFGKRVTLHRGLNHGSVIFLRLLQPMSDDRGHAVAYEAELIASDDQGQHQFRLRPVRSRPGRHIDLCR